MSFFVRFLNASLLAIMPISWSRCLLERCNAKKVSVDFNQSKKKSNQLLVDVSVIYQTDARTGIQRVVRALLLQLFKARIKGYEIFPVFATNRSGYRYADIAFLENRSHFFTKETQSKCSEVKVQGGDIFLGLDLAAHLLPKHRRQLLSWKYNGVKLHVLVYDLLPLQYPEWFNAKTTKNFKRWIEWLAVYADSAVCISQSVASQLSDYLENSFGLSKSKLTTSTIVLGANINASAPSKGMPIDAQSLLNQFRKNSTILMVGTLEPRKGHDQALAAFELLWQTSEASPLLVIVGQQGWKTESLQNKLRTHPQNGKRLFWLENVSDEYLTQLYAACTGVLVASKAEGFGLPVIESIIQANSVLVRDIPVFREIPLPDDCFFSGESASDLASSISNWILNKPVLFPSEIAEIRQNFSWEMSAFQLCKSLGIQFSDDRVDQSEKLSLGDGAA